MLGMEAIPLECRPSGGFLSWFKMAQGYERVLMGEVGGALQGVCLISLSLSLFPCLSLSLSLSVSLCPFVSVSLSLSLTFCLCSFPVSVSLSLSLCLRVFKSPSGTFCVKTGPLVGGHLPILNTHFLSPSREPAQLTPSCP